MPCKVDDLLETVVSLSETRKKARSKAQTRIETALIAISSHAKAIDVLIQQQPDITAVVWGAFRFLLGVCEQCHTYSGRGGYSRIQRLTEELNRLRQKK